MLERSFVVEGHQQQLNVKNGRESSPDHIEQLIKASDLRIKESLNTPMKLDKLKAKMSLEYRLMKVPNLTYDPNFVSMMRRLGDFERRAELPELASKMLNLPVKQALFWSLKQMLHEILTTEDPVKQRSYVERVSSWFNAKLKYLDAKPKKPRTKEELEQRESRKQEKQKKK